MTQRDLFNFAEKEPAAGSVSIAGKEPATETVPLAPLAVRMRPNDLDEFAGQEHILGKGKLLRRAIEADRVTSLILYGPPGCGKNVLANIISAMTKAEFVQINAVTSGVADIRGVIDRAEKNRRQRGKKTILFIDEIHRFNKLQQDALLPDVENGMITLIGATTQNPYFYVNSALQSRSNIFQLNPLSKQDLKKIFDRALADRERGLGNLKIDPEEKAVQHWLEVSNGDARKLLNSLELAVLTTVPDDKGIVRIDLKTAEDSIQRTAVLYDKDGDGHYDTISAFIKSIRGSDPDAAIYWLAKMLSAGEDPRFIARRLVISASEDIGNADPDGLQVAVSAYTAVEFIGMPEARIPLAQAVIYLATAPKSNKAYLAISEAMLDIEKETTEQVPVHLKDANYQGAKKLGHGEGYKYPHSFEGHYVEQEYFSGKKKYFTPSDQGFEKLIEERIKKMKDKK